MKGESEMRTKLFLVAISAFLLTGCFSNKAQVMGTAGAVTGAAITKNPWKGAVIGGAIGAAAGHAMDEIDSSNQKQNIQLQNNGNPRTNCEKVRKVRTEGGRVISDTVEEVCRGKMSSNSY